MQISGFGFLADDMHGAENVSPIQDLSSSDISKEPLDETQVDGERHTWRRFVDELQSKDDDF